MGIQHVQARKAMLDTNISNIKLVEQLKNVNPAYGKHMLIANSLIEMMFKKGILANEDILDLPMCPTCERPMMNDVNGQVYCEKHGSSKTTKTFREYLMEDVLEFGFDAETMALLEQISEEAYKEEQDELSSINPTEAGADETSGQSILL